MSFGDVEHFATMVAGCESITSGQPLTPDGKYAVAVLKLHYNDVGGRAGNESFLDTVKKGASDVKEWVLKLIKAIKEWWNTSTKENDSVKLVQDVKKASPEEQEKLKKNLQSTVESLKTNAERWNAKLNETLKSPEWAEAKSIIGFSESGFDKNLVTLRKLMTLTGDNDPSPVDIITELSDFVNIGRASTQLGDKLESYVKRFSNPEELRTERKEAVKSATTVMQTIASISESGHKYLKKMKSEWRAIAAS